MRGLKLHLGNSGVTPQEPSHVRRLREVFAAAEQLRAPIVVHMRARGGVPYGAPDAVNFLNDQLPAAPNIVVQVAHFGGAGPGYPDYVDAAMALLAEAVARGDSRARNLYFDVTTIATADTTSENGALIARRVRQVGAARVLFGSDAPVGSNPRPMESWEIFK